MKPQKMTDHCGTRMAKGGTKLEKQLQPHTWTCSEGERVVYRDILVGNQWGSLLPSLAFSRQFGNQYSQISSIPDKAQYRHWRVSISCLTADRCREWNGGGGKTWITRAGQVKHFPLALIFEGKLGLCLNNVFCKKCLSAENLDFSLTTQMPENWNILDKMWI